MVFIILVVIIIVLFSIRKYRTIEVPPIKNLCPKPPMGWNSWTCFGTEVNEVLIKMTVDALKAKGLTDYEYVVVDDGWMDSTRGPDGALRWCPKKFPSGMKALGKYIHDNGFKFGIYTSVGRFTCEGYPGSYDHEEQDAATFASWDVDYVKLDWCTYKWLWWPFWNYRYRYQLMSKAITNNGRDMVIAMCNWGFGGSVSWGKDLAHTTRITYDVGANEGSIMRILAKGKAQYKWNKPNGWNDLDSLEIGNGIPIKLGKEQFYWWRKLRSPLFIGADVTTLTDEEVAVLKSGGTVDADSGTA